MTKKLAKKMCNLLDRYGVDFSKEELGAKMYIDEENDVYILVTPFNGRNSDLQRGIADLALIHGDNVDTKEYTLDSHKNFIKACVKGWNNICGADGKEIEFSVDTAIDILSKTPDLVDELFKFSFERDNYKLGDAIKN